MSNFFKYFLLDEKAEGHRITGPSLFLGIFGKYPSELGHFKLSLVTSTLELAHALLYVHGVAELVQGAGNFEKLSSDQMLGWDHAFLWCRGGQSMLGRFWKSSDAGGRADFPLFSCIHAVGVGPGWLVQHGLRELELLKNQCLAAAPAGSSVPPQVQKVLQEQLQFFVTSTINRLSTSLNDSPAQDLVKNSPPSMRGQFLTHPSLGPFAGGLIRILQKVQDRLAGYASGRMSGWFQKLPASKRLRVPAAAASLADSLWLWHDLLQAQLAEEAPVLYLAPANGEWIDIIVGEPTAADLFWLRANLRRLGVESEGAPLSCDDTARFEAFIKAFESGTAMPGLFDLPQKSVPEKAPTELAQAKTPPTKVQPAPPSPKKTEEITAPVKPEPLAKPQEPRQVLTTPVNSQASPPVASGPAEEKNEQSASSRKSPHTGKVTRLALVLVTLAGAFFLASQLIPPGGKETPPVRGRVLPATPLRIVRQPSGQRLLVGQSLKLEVVAEASTPIRYQWYANASALSGATNSVLNFVKVSTNVTGSYYAVASAGPERSTSAVAAVTVDLPAAPPTVFAPVFTRQPQSIEVIEGSAAPFTCQATGSTPLAFQWFWNGKPVANAQQPTLSLTAASPVAKGEYRVVVTNVAGAITSTPVLLTVKPLAKAPVITRTATNQARPLQPPVEPPRPVKENIAPPPARLTNSIGMELVLVRNLAPSRKDAYVAVFEVTQEQYQKVFPDVPAGLSRDTPATPARGIRDGAQAISFCDALTQTELKNSVTPPEIARLLKQGWRYSLLAETEWKSLAQQSDPARSATALNKAFLTRDPLPVHRLKALEGEPPHGLYGLFGNVWEWCLEDGSSSRCVLKGGSVLDLAVEMGYPGNFTPGPLSPEGRGARVDLLFRGFRCVLHQ